MKWTAVKVALKKSKLHGRGVFAAEKIPAKQLIATANGAWVCPRDLERAPSKRWRYWLANFAYLHYNELVLLRGPMKFVNHNDDPNVVWVNECCFAKRDIEKGEELTEDYRNFMLKRFKGGNKFGYPLDQAPNSEGTRREQVIEIGLHKVTCASIESGAIDQMLAGEKVWVLYSDPPWDNMRYWQTLNQRMTGKLSAQITHDQLYDRIVDLIRRYVKGYVFIETGVKQEAYVLGRLRSVTKHLASIHLTYEEGPQAFIYGSVNGPLPKIPRDTEDFESQVLCHVAKPDGIVLDPCCGLGATANATIVAAMRFRGNEYNEKRLEETIQILERAERPGKQRAMGAAR